MLRFVLYKDMIDEWRWTLIAANNRKIADSAEGYRRKIDCMDAVYLVKSSSRAKVIVKRK